MCDQNRSELEERLRAALREGRRQMSPRLREALDSLPAPRLRYRGPRARIVESAVGTGDQGDASSAGD